MRPVPKWFVSACWAMAIGFSLCAGLQVDDPDPIRWVGFYAAAAIAAAVLPARRIAAIPAAVVGLFAAAWGAYLFSRVTGVLAVSDLWMKMSEKGGAVEVGREAAGLGVVALVLLACAGFRAMRA